MKKTLIIGVALMLSNIAKADVFNKFTQACILEEIRMQHMSIFELSKMESMHVFADDQNNWEAIVLSKYEQENVWMRSFLTVTDGNVSESRLNIEGLKSRSVDLSRCF